MIGKTISHYRIISKLGEGGMGVVYKAEDLKLKRTVALKFLPSSLTSDRSAKARFMHEAQAAASLSHPNIATIYEIDEAEGLLFIAMEYVKGQSLKEKIAEGPLELAEVLDLGEQIVTGLQEAHEKGIVHRDIKPANIMLTGKGRAKIMDFGLACSPEATKLTKTGTIVGTAAYLSPEQVQGAEIDQRTDIWSLGVVLYQMVTGNTPFQADHEQAILYAILNRDTKPVTALRSGVPMRLERLIHKSLSKSPGNRYQHASELAEDLRGASRSDGGIATGAIRAGKDRLGITSRILIILASFLAILAVFLAIYMAGDRGPGKGKQTNKRIMLAVLPFDNLGEPEDAYFADGVSDEILTKLSVIPELGVIARESSFRYRGDEFTIEEIGRELKVDYVLKGAIRWQRAAGGSSRIRVTPKLISVAENRNIWADAYEEELNQVFAVQTSIAERVTEALDITLMESKWTTINEVPTENIDAYNYYLRARELYIGTAQAEKLLMARDLFIRSISLDSNFALAHAWLSMNNSSIYHYNVDRSLETMMNARNAYENALSINPRLAEALVAQGRYYYYAERDYERAQISLQRARKLNPNDWWTIYTIGLVKKRQGKFDESKRLFLETINLNPANKKPLVELGVVYEYLREYGAAVEAFEKTIEMWPEDHWIYVLLADLYMKWDLFKARETTEQATNIFGVDKLNVIWHRIYTLERDFQKALESITYTTYDTLNYCIKRSQVYHYAGDALEKTRSADKARLVLEEKVRTNPDDYYYHRRLGIVYALLGYNNEAIREAEYATALMPVSKDALLGTDLIEDMARVYVLVGEYDAAIEQLDHLLAMPSEMSVTLLKNDPVWDPLRTHPRFQELVE